MTRIKKNMSVVIALCMVIAFALCGCGGPTPTETADTFLTAVKAGDADTIKTVYEGETFDLMPKFDDEETDNDDSTSDNLMDDSVYEETLLPKLQDFDYELSNEKIDGDKATVDVKITTYDFGTAISAFFTEYITQAFSLAFSDTSEEELNKIGETIFQTKINELTEKTYSEIVTLDLVKKDNGWKVCKIDDNSDFLNAISGNMIKAIEQLEDTYSFDE